MSCLRPCHGRELLYPPVQVVKLQRLDPQDGVGSAFEAQAAAPQVQPRLSSAAMRANTQMSQAQPVYGSAQAAQPQAAQGEPTSQVTPAFSHSVVIHSWRRQSFHKNDLTGHARHHASVPIPDRAEICQGCPVQGAQGQSTSMLSNLAMHQPPTCGMPSFLLWACTVRLISASLLKRDISKAL